MTQVDDVLLSYPEVAEAVAFGCPDEKYGEIVAAAVVPAKQPADPAALVESIKQHCGQKLAKFKAGLLCFCFSELYHFSRNAHGSYCSDTITIKTGFLMASGTLLRRGEGKCTLLIRRHKK